MDLSLYEKMIEERMEIKPFPISDKELCDRFLKAFSGAINDVLRELGLLTQTLPSNILPLREEMRVCGIAFTVKGAPDLDIESELEYRAEMLEALHEDSVVVWDTNGDIESAQWGEVMTMAAKRQGCLGAVVDGGVRDTNMVLKQKFPVFCKYRTSNGMLGRFRMISFQKPIVIGQVTIYPGDIVFGDIDGVLIIPRPVAYDILLRTERVLQEEVEVKDMVNEGLSPTEVVARGGYF